MIKNYKMRKFLGRVSKFLILLRNQSFLAKLPVFIIALKLFEAGFNTDALNIALGIDSTLLMHAVCTVIVTGLVVMMIALSFEERRARKTAKCAKEVVFCAFYWLLAYIAVPVLFMITATLCHGEYGLLTLILLAGAVPFGAMLFLMLSIKDIENGIKRNLRERRFLSIRA